METSFANQVQRLQEQANSIINHIFQIQRRDENAEITIPQDFQQEFFSLVDKVNLSLMEDKEHFYGYFLLQMAREIRFELTSPTGVNFKGAKYVIYFNPAIFLNLNLKQMESTIKHEILHIVSMHLSRAKEFKGRCSKSAVNMAMNIIVNTWLDYLPPYSVTLEWVNANYSLKLLPFKPFEYYVEKIQAELNLLEADEEASADDHDIWEESDDIDEKTLQEFTEKFVDNAQKGSLPNYLESKISSLKSSKGELPWNLYLKRMMGTVENNKKKTVARRDRRQPERLDLRGELRGHKAKIAVALDISGSISDQEFNQAMQEVLAIVKNYNHEIMIIECDSEIRRVYEVRSAKDIRERMDIRGGTRFTPVFEYANQNKVNLLIYFTDGQGEEQLLVKPKGYKTLWVLSGHGDKFSLQEPYGAVKKLKNIVKDEEAYLLKISDIKKEGYSMNDQEGMNI